MDRKAAAEKERRFDELKAAEKPLHELVATEILKINHVIARSREVTINSLDKTGIKNVPHSYDAGYTATTVLRATYFFIANSPAITLEFKGHTAVRGGDIVAAKILKFEKVEARMLPGVYRTFYVDRDLGERERAIELAILVNPRNKNQNYTNYTRVDRSVDYDQFQPKS